LLLITLLPELAAAAWQIGRVGKMYKGLWQFPVALCAKLTLNCKLRSLCYNPIVIKSTFKVLLKRPFCHWNSQAEP
jgi:hypothetical protein